MRRNFLANRYPFLPTEIVNQQGTMLVLATGHDFQFMRDPPEVPHDL
jgi:hypothetical protein